MRPEDGSSCQVEAHLLALSDFNTYNPILQDEDILTLLTSLDRAGKSVTFCWIPSHVGIAGNERADEAAKRASQAQLSRFLPLPARDSLTMCSSHISSKWQEYWESSGPSKLKAIKPRLAPWSSSMRASRREEVQLCRLRIGHTLATHRYMLWGDRRPAAPDAENVFQWHTLLVFCRHLVIERVRCFGSSSLTLRELLDDGSGHIPRVFRFLNHIKFPMIFLRRVHLINDALLSL